MYQYVYIGILVHESLRLLRKYCNTNEAHFLLYSLSNVWSCICMSMILFSHILYETGKMCTYFGAFFYNQGVNSRIQH